MVMSGIFDDFSFDWGSTVTGAVNAVQARIQTYVARFLALKQPLLQLQGSPDPTVAQQAAVLSQAQATLESQLPGVLHDIDQIRAGTFDAGALGAMVVELSSFAVNLESHVSEAEDLIAGAGGSVPGYTRVPFLGSVSVTTLLLVGGGLLVVLWAMRRS